MRRAWGMRLSPQAERLWQILGDLEIDLAAQDRFTETEKRCLAMFVGTTPRNVGNLLRECRTVVAL